MSPGVGVEEVLVTAKCNRCGIYTRGLSQEEAVKFRDTHAQHEGMALTLTESEPAPAVSDPARWLARVLAVRDELERLGEACRVLFRSVGATSVEQLERARRTAASERAEASRVLLLNTQTLTGTADAFTRAVNEAQQVVTEIQPVLTAAQAQVIQKRRAAELAPMSRNIVEQRLSAHEETLAAVQTALGEVRYLLTQAEPRHAKFQDQARLAVQAALIACREALRDRAQQRLAEITAELTALRTPDPHEQSLVRLAERASVTSTPGLVWRQDDLLAPPELQAPEESN